MILHSAIVEGSLNERIIIIGNGIKDPNFKFRTMQYTWHFALILFCHSLSVTEGLAKYVIHLYLVTCIGVQMIGNILNTLEKILIELFNAVNLVLFSILLWISNSYNLFQKQFKTIASSLIMMGLIITLMFHKLALFSQLFPQFHFLSLMFRIWKIFFCLLMMTNPSFHDLICLSKFDNFNF